MTAFAGHVVANTEDHCAKRGPRGAEELSLEDIAHVEGDSRPL